MTATSIKSVDLTASSYESAGALSSRLNGYVNKAAAFDSYTLEGVRVTSSMITTRELMIAIQPGVATASQMEALIGVFNYGASQGVVVRVVSIP